MYLIVVSWLFLSKSFNTLLCFKFIQYLALVNTFAYLTVNNDDLLPNKLIRLHVNEHYVLMDSQAQRALQITLFDTLR